MPSNFKPKEYILFTSYFSPAVCKQMDLTFGKLWPALLYMQFHYKKTKTNMIHYYDVKVMAGAYLWNKVEAELAHMCAPLMEQVPMTNRTYQLTKAGMWLTEFMWKYVDVLMKSENKKTLTQILEEKTIALKMTIDEINSISQEEKERDKKHEQIVDINNKLSTGNLMPQLT